MFAYVLCRVFQKNGLGPPNGNRYAPFVEEEWDDGGSALVPGVEAADDMVAVDDTFLDGNNLQQETEFTRNPPHSGNEIPTDSQNVSPVKNERLDDSPFPCVVNREEPFPILHYKRRRHNDDSNNSNASENSSGTNQDHCSSTTTTATTMTITSANLPSTALELSLTESLQRKESPNPIPGSDTAKIDAPYCCVKFINNLQNEIHKISIERETLKLEMMSAQVMINILQSQIEYLSNENYELRNRKVGDG